MSALNTGEKPCGIDGNGCLCYDCVFFHLNSKARQGPFSCTPNACHDCDPDRTEPDDEWFYGPLRECKHFIREESEVGNDL